MDAANTVDTTRKRHRNQVDKTSIQNNVARPARLERATCRVEDGCSDPLN